MILESCPLCAKGMLHPLREVAGVPYLRCDGCGSILAESAFLQRTMAGEARNYDDDYWSEELKAAKERGYGTSLIRLAEVFYYARRPIRRFLDVSCGAGTLLDSAAELLPEIADIFWGIEPFPPPPAFRAKHANYRVGFLRDLDGKFDAGTCIEVIQHLPPPVLRSMLTELAAVSQPDALWYFNSAQPDFVEREDPAYLDPYHRGHIASYSIEGLSPVFAEAGFTLHALPGRNWAFLAEFAKRRPEDSTALLSRVWQMRPANRKLLESARFGPLLLSAGMEGARCYIEAAVGGWAVAEMRRGQVDSHREEASGLLSAQASEDINVARPNNSVLAVVDSRGAASSEPNSLAAPKGSEMPLPSGDYAKRLKQEIAVFQGQDRLHEHAAAFHHYTAHFVGPLLEAAFGRRDLYEIYAESIASAVARSGLTTVFSLGCGDGQQERQVMLAADRLGLPRFSITGIEIAPSVAERANRATEEAGLADRLKVIIHDLNAGLPGTDGVAAVMVHHVLHHIVDLEGLFDRLAERLHPKGALVTFDMIGRNGHRRWPEVTPLCRRIWAALPLEKRHDHQFGQTSPFYLDWDCAVEGFEGVRAQDILPLLAERFQVSRFAAWGGLADILVSPRFAKNFDPTRPEDRTFLDAIGALERRLLDERRTTPASMAAEFVPKRIGASAPTAALAALEKALRGSDEVFASLADVPFTSPYPPQLPNLGPTLHPGMTYPAVAGSVLAEAMHEGFANPETDGAWALLDEQYLRFRTVAPVTEVAVEVWSFLPPERRQAITASAHGIQPVTMGDLTLGAHTIRLQSGLPKRHWEIRLSPRTYRRPDTDSGTDLRPIAYGLIALTVGPITISTKCGRDK